MRKYSKRPRRPLTICELCARAIDFPSGFFFDRGDGTVAHPDCQSYVFEHPDVLIPAGSRFLHTCGEANCVNPAHLQLQRPLGEL